MLYKNKEIFNIRITAATLVSPWYKNAIGCDFEVIEHDSMFYEVVEEEKEHEFINHLIRKEDAEIV